MSENTGPRYPALCPYLYYEDTPAAMDWLARAFGFRERLRSTDADGSVRHAEMELGDAVIMMGSPPGHKSAVHLGQVTSSLYVRVGDVDAHYRRAVSAGAPEWAKWLVPLVKAPCTMIVVSMPHRASSVE